VEPEDVVHVLRNVHEAVRPDGLVLEIHPLGIDMPVCAGRRGLGFVDVSEFAVIAEGVDAAVDGLVDDGLLDELARRERHVVERFDTGDEAVEELCRWEDLHAPEELLQQLREAEERPIELVEAVGYRLLRRV
jgi:hypothetical protein